MTDFTNKVPDSFQKPRMLLECKDPVYETGFIRTLGELGQWHIKIKKITKKTLNQRMQENNQVQKTAWFRVSRYYSVYSTLLQH